MSNIFDPQLVEFMDLEPTDTESCVTLQIGGEGTKCWVKAIDNWLTIWKGNNYHDKRIYIKLETSVWKKYNVKIRKMFINYFRQTQIIHRWLFHFFPCIGKLLRGNGQRVNILHFLVSVTTTQCCHCIARDNTCLNHVLCSNVTPKTQWVCGHHFCPLPYPIYKSQLPLTLFLGNEEACLLGYYVRHLSHPHFPTPWFHIV